MCGLKVSSFCHSDQSHPIKFCLLALGLHSFVRGFEGAYNREGGDLITKDIK